VTMKARALPLSQPERLTTSWTSALRSGVRWLAPADPRLQAAGDQPASASVRAREEILKLAVEKVAALSASWALIVRFVATECAPAAVN